MREIASETEFRAGILSMNLYRMKKGRAMREEDIRPDRLMRENSRLHKKDVQRLLRRKDEFKEVACPACGISRSKVIFKKGGFIFDICEECDTVFVNPRPSFGMLKEFYASSKSIKHWNDKIFSVSEDSRRDQIFSQRAKRIASLCGEYGTRIKILIDVGAGFGTFCEEVKKLAIFERIIAVEPSRDLAATCRRKGIEVIEKPIEEVKLEGADVITCFELIEHLYDPQSFIMACGKALSREGLLILTTPNIKGFDLSLLSKVSDNIAAPNHLNYFHPGSIQRLLECRGFKVTALLTPGKLDAEIVRKKILSGEFDTSNCNFLKYILIERWNIVGEKFQDFLAENKLSSHLWVVAKKT